MKFILKLFMVYLVILGSFLIYINNQTQYTKVLGHFSKKELPEAVIGFKDVLTDFEMVRIKSATGDAESQYKMGKIYHKSDFVPNDDKKSFGYYKKSAEKKYAPAKKELVNSYAKGIGVEKDSEKALRIANELSDAGNSDIDIAMAIHYRKGDGNFEVDYVKAKAWAVRAINKRNVEAYNVLGLIYFAQALKYNNANFLKHSFKAIQMGARQGNKNAQFRLGVYYGFGIGTESHLFHAKQWLKKSEHESANAVISEFMQHYNHVRSLNKVLAARYEADSRMNLINRAKDLVGLDEKIKRVVVKNEKK